MSRAHTRLHHKLEAEIQALLPGARERLGVEPVWSIEICVCCPEDLPQAEASIWWHAELFYARLYIRCSHQHHKTRKTQRISDQIIKRLVYHELCELQTWRTVNFVRELMQSHIRLLETPRKEPNYAEVACNLQEQWQLVRNQEIESRLYGLLGDRRPEYLERDYVEIWTDYVKQDQKMTRGTFELFEKGNSTHATTTVPLDQGEESHADGGERPLLQ